MNLVINKNGFSQTNYNKNHSRQVGFASHFTLEYPLGEYGSKTLVNMSRKDPTIECTVVGGKVVKVFSMLDSKDNEIAKTIAEAGGSIKKKTRAEEYLGNIISFYQKLTTGKKLSPEETQGRVHSFLEAISAE